MLLLWSATVTYLGLGMDQQDNVIIIKEVKLEKLLKKQPILEKKKQQLVWRR
jgi:hypothetical protein